MTTDLDHALARLEKAVNGRYRFRLDSVDVGFEHWIFDSSAQVVVMLSKTVLLAADKLPEKEYQKYYFHPFFGTFPHEVQEGRVTDMMLRGQWDNLRGMYPNFKWNGFAVKKCIEFTLPTAKQLREIYSTGSLGKWSFFGGEAHDIIISPNRDSYYKYVFSMYDRMKIPNEGYGTLDDG